MNKIKQLLHRNIKLIIALLIFVSIGAGVTYSATTYLYNSNVIGYNNSNSGLTSTNVQGALDELYDTCVNSTNCPDGYVCYEKIDVLPMFEQNAVSDAVKSTYVSSNTGINFAAISSDTNGKGLYLRSGTELSGHPIYYYRGAVDNNNVIFANYCWKIVRTTETGGIKLAYSGIANDSQCLDSADYVGTSAFDTNWNYRYVNNSSGTNVDSAIKTYIDNWYETNMLSYTSYLEDTVWCNDTTTLANNRIAYGSPTTICPEVADSYTVNSANGNGLLTYPIGLLTADEIVLAGASSSTTNGTFYLYSPLTTNKWSMSVSSIGGGDSYPHIWYYVSTFAQNWPGFNYGVQPAVSLKYGVSFSYGNGTASNPYVVATS